MDPLITCVVFRKLESAPALMLNLASDVVEEARPLIRCLSFHKGMNRRQVSWDIFSEELTFHEDDPAMCISVSMLKPIQPLQHDKDSRRASAASLSAD